MEVYYYDARIVPVYQWKINTIRTVEHYVHMRAGRDPFSNLSASASRGTPKGHIEVLYFPELYNPQRCTLGFRDEVRGSIEWLYFRKSADELLQSTNENGKRMFRNSHAFGSGGYRSLGEDKAALLSFKSCKCVHGPQRPPLVLT